MNRDDSASPAPAAHRPWRAIDCPHSPHVVEGTHRGAAWSLVPEDAGQIQLRPFESTGEHPRYVGVLLSVTERRLATEPDLIDLRSRTGLVDITSSAGLTANEAGQLADELRAFASWSEHHDRTEER